VGSSNGQISKSVELPFDNMVRAKTNDPTIFEIRNTNSWLLLDTWLADTESANAYDLIIGYSTDSWTNFVVVEELDLSVFNANSQGGIYTTGGLKAEEIRNGKAGTNSYIYLSPDTDNSFILASSSGTDVTLAADDDLVLHADDDIFFQAGGATKMTLLNDGQLDFADGGSIQLANGTGASPASDHVRLSEETDALRIDTEHGYIRVGPLNSTYMHFITDRGLYYFNKEIVVDNGVIGSHNEDLYLKRARSSDEQILIQDNSMTFTSAGLDVMHIDGTSGSIQSAPHNLNTCVPYVFNRSDMGTGAVNLKAVSNDYPSTQNQWGFIMPKSGRIKYITLNTRNQAVTSSNVQTWKINNNNDNTTSGEFFEFTAGKGLTKDDTGVSGSAAMDLAVAPHSTTIYRGSMVVNHTFDALDEIRIQRETANSVDMGDTVGVIYVEFD